MKPVSLFRCVLMAGAVLLCAAGYAQSTQNVKAIKAWYGAWMNKDWNSLTQVLADGFTFSSPLDDHLNIKAVKEKCWPNAYKIGRMNMDKVVVEGDRIFVISNGWTTAGKLFRNGDYFQLKNGKISAYECFFGPGVNYPNSGK